MVLITFWSYFPVFNADVTPKSTFAVIPLKKLRESSKKFGLKTWTVIAKVEKVIITIKK